MEDSGMTVATMITDRPPAATFVLVAAMTVVMVGACRRKEADPGAAANLAAPPPPVRYLTGDAAVSDKILEGLQHEVETARRLHPETAERVKAVRPVVTCVEAISPTQWRARFGYTNSSGDDVPIAISAFNRFWPPPLGRQQPQLFAAGSRNDVAQANFNPISSTAWILGSEFVVANAHSPVCPKKP
jgi:hypothetical protein